MRSKSSSDWSKRAKQRQTASPNLNKSARKRQNGLSKRGSGLSRSERQRLSVQNSSTRSWRGNEKRRQREPGRRENG